MAVVLPQKSPPRPEVQAGPFTDASQSLAGWGAAGLQAEPAWLTRPSDTQGRRNQTISRYNFK